MSADGKCAKDLKRRISLTSAMVNEFSKLWRSTRISNETKMKLYETFVVPVLLHGSECWCSRKLVRARIKNGKRTAASKSYINGKRNQGRQPKTLMDNVNKDIEAKKLTVQQAVVLVWYRNIRKHQVASSSLKWLKRAEEEELESWRTRFYRVATVLRGGA